MYITLGSLSLSPKIWIIYFVNYYNGMFFQLIQSELLALIDEIEYTGLSYDKMFMKCTKPGCLV